MASSCMAWTASKTRSKSQKSESMWSLQKEGAKRAVAGLRNSPQERGGLCSFDNPEPWEQDEGSSSVEGAASCVPAVVSRAGSCSGLSTTFTFSESAPDTSKAPTTIIANVVRREAIAP